MLLRLYVSCCISNFKVYLRTLDIEHRIFAEFTLLAYNYHLFPWYSYNVLKEVKYGPVVIVYVICFIFLFYFFLFLHFN